MVLQVLSKLCKLPVSEKVDQGTVWFGCAGGLYKMAKEGEVIYVTTHGPWR